MSRPTEMPTDSSEPRDPLNDGHGPLLAALLDQARECIELLDQEGRILFVNREGARLMESRSPTDLIGQIWTERWPESLRPTLEKALESARRGDVARFTGARPAPDQALRWWDITISPIRVETGAITQFLTIARDTTAESMEYQRIAAISAEMHHRMRNALTIAAGILTMSARGQPEVQPFASEVAARFQQLAALQDLLFDPSRKKRFADIIPRLASAYGDASMLRFDGLPDVQLGDGAIQALALAFGELATNSLKYGALKHGRPIDIGGAVVDTLLQLTWREPTEFGAPRTGAQGLGLIERLVTASGGRVERAFDDGFLVVRLWLPILG